jgi:AcrR family transcriptional regulator
MRTFIRLLHPRCIWVGKPPTSVVKSKGSIVKVLDIVGPVLSGSALIRNEPVQARSTARLATLLDSAAAVIAEIGYERLTTAMVAERAGASIGTVYRYFPDRIAILQSLAARNAERMMGQVAAEVVAGQHSSATDAVVAIIEITAELFRREPGYRSLRGGDVLDLLPPRIETTANAALADVVADSIVLNHGVSNSADMRRAVSTAVEIVDALVARAFARSTSGNSSLLAEAERSVRAVLAGQL